MKNFTINNKNAGTDFSDTRFAHHGAFSDGSKLLKPHIVHGEFDIKPLKISKSDCRMLIINFLGRGYSIHDRTRSAAWVILEYCKAKGIKYVIDGNTIRKV